MNDMTARQDILFRCAVIVVLFAIAVLSGGMRRQVLHAGYSHPDEDIARAVVTKVLATKKKDTNWARTDVEELFRYNQFNFSSYYLAAAKLEKFAGHRAEDLGRPHLLLDHLREQNIWLGGLATFLAGLLGWRIASLHGMRVTAAAAAGIVATALTASCVTLFQDSIYARPEAFVTVLTLVFTFLLLMPGLATIVVLALTGVVLGILVATKITFILFLPFPLLAISARAHDRDPAGTRHPHPWRVAGAIGFYLACCVAGFGFGAPYALRAPWEYLEGIGFLLRQYSTAGWPNGLHDGGVGARFMHGLSYLAYTDGLLVLALAVIGFVMLLRAGRHGIVVAVTGPLLTLAYFLQTRAFFERNFSHALPVVFALSGVGLCLAVDWIVARARRGPAASRALRIASACLGAGLAIYVPASLSKRLHETILDTTEEKRIDAAMDKVNEGGRVPVLFGYSTLSDVPKMRGGLCGRVIYKLLEYGDAYSKSVIVDLAAQGYAVAGELRGPFDGAPISTLQTYHATNVLFLSSPPDDGPACRAELIAPISDAAYVEVDAQVTLSSSWTRDGYPPGMSVQGWKHPFYASWTGSDGNTGDMHIGPFEACGDVIVPFAVGPIRNGTELLIERTIDGRRETLTSGPPPQTITWSAIRIPAGASCATYSIEARDHGEGYGQWIGVGLPVELRTPGSPLPAQSAAAVQRPLASSAPQCGQKNCKKTR